ncbi:MAG: cytochrome b/b6 domain-containing protein [Gemmatimonadota bacterium]|nr:cytochrome b/b6 domain-containing protein [Gemmatimonadota bacterium]
MTGNTAIARPAHEAAERSFVRLSRFQRGQHLAMLVSFLVLAITGIPMRFPQVHWLGGIYAAVGGLPVARAIHRVAALVMIADGAVHLVYLGALLVRRRFRLWEAWPMLPTWKDAQDWWATSLYYFGIRRELPAYDRFNFREKFDYFAVFWGLPVMMISGLILWFPVFFGNHLPDIAIPMAYIAHSDEAILAISAIVVWHFYNVHYNPDKFPMSWVWITGRISEEEIRREHPLEYERLRKVAAHRDATPTEADASAAPGGAAADRRTI